MTEYLIIYLYADGLIETNARYTDRLEGALSLDDLITRGWRMVNIGVMAYSPTRNLGWCMAVMERQR